MKRWWTSAFGKFSWEKPQWLGKARGAFNWGKQNPLYLLTVVLLIAAAGYGGWWWKHRPKPVTTSVTLYPPPVTAIEKERHPNGIYIRFGSSVAPLAAIGKQLTSGLRLDPPHPGKWQWNSQQDLQFIPEKDWPIAQKYSLRFDPGLVASQVRLEKTKLEFQITPFSARFDAPEFYQDPTNPAVKRVVGQLTFNYPVEPGLLEKAVKVKLDKRDIGFRVIFSELKDKAFIHSDPVAILEKKQTLTISVDRGVKSSLGGNALPADLAQNKDIPSLLDFFKIESLTTAVAQTAQNEPQHVIVLRLSDTARPEDMAKSVSAWLLPRFHPRDQNKPDDEKQPFNWLARSGEINQDLLKTADKVELKALPVEHEAESTVNFSYEADPRRYMFVRVAKGAKSFGGFILGADFTATLLVPEYPRELRVMGQGAILSLAGDKKLSVFARDVNEVKVQVRQLFPDDINHFVSQSNGDLKRLQFNNAWSFGYQNISVTHEETVKVPLVRRGAPQYFTVDLARFITPEKKGVFSIRLVTVDPKAGAKPTPVPAYSAPVESEGEGEFVEEAGGPDEGEYIEAQAPPKQVTEERLVLVTDLGFVYKENLDHSRSVFVQRFSTGAPVGGARVAVVGVNGQTIMSRTTDLTGRAEFPNLADFKNEKDPMVYTIESGADLSFMPYKKGADEQDTSRFEVGGVANAASQGELKAYLFSDRGIYRPGDEVRIGLMVKAADWRKNLAGVPVKIQVMDPKGVEFKKFDLKLSETAFEDLRFSTFDGSPTGDYRVVAYLLKDKNQVSYIGATSVKVEEFLPDRMKIAMRFSTEKAKGWVHPKDLKATVHVENLFGTPAEERLVRASLHLQPSFAGFAAYKDYQFFDPLYDPKKSRGYEEALQEAKTAANGEVTFDLNLERFEKASYWLNVRAEAFEAEGGRGVFIARGLLVSPLEYFVGFKSEQRLNYLKRGSKASASVIAVNADLVKTAVADLTVVLYERKFVSVLSERPNGTLGYVSKEKEDKLSERPFAIAKGEVQLPLDTGKPGDFFYKILAKDGMTLAKIPFSVAGEANLTRSLERNAELQIRLAKEDYNPGEEIELEIRSPYSGSGLITIERDHVYNHVWFKTDKTNSVQHIRIPEHLEGNGYVSVTFLRSLNSKEIYMSPLSFGVAAFSISKRSRTENITLHTPEKIQPGKPLRMQVKTSHPTRLVLYAVDEGILQVAGYANPDPVGFYLSKKKLDVRTFQILDLLLPEHRLYFENAAPGGGSEVPAPSTNLNPFKRKTKPPVVFWSGILDVGEEGAEVVYDVPDYFNGTLRVVAVAVSQATVGVSFKQVLVQAPIIIAANVPTFVAPGDRFQVSAGVTNNLETATEPAAVTLSLSLSANLKLLSAKDQPLKIAHLREEKVVFEVEAQEPLGNADLKFTAQSGATSITAQESLSVRPASAYRVTFQAGNLGQGDKSEIARERDLYSEYREITAEHGFVPSSLLTALRAYLAKYPYGCTEQIASQTLPYLTLAGLKDYGISRGKAEEFIGKTVDVLRSRLTFEGNYGLWAAFTGGDEWASLWAMHVLIEAKERGYAIPETLLEKNRDYLKDYTQRVFEDPWKMRGQAYGIYLLTRMGVNTGAAANRLSKQYDEMKMKDWKSQVEGLFLASSYQMLQSAPAAQKILSGFKLGDAIAPNYQFYYDKTYRDALYFYLMTKHFPLVAKDFSEKQYAALIALVSKGQCNTFSAAHLFLALESLLKGNATVDATAFQIAARKTGKPMPLPLQTLTFGQRAEIPADYDAVVFQNRSQTPLSYYSLSTSGFERGLPKEELKGGLEVVRLFLRNRAEIKTPVKLGEEIEVEVRLRGLSSPAYYVALVDLLPGGFEPLIDSLRGYRHADVGETEQGDNASPDSVAKGAVSEWRPCYTDVREDRVIFYGCVVQQAVAARYKIKAVNAGTYTIPPLFAESMYDRGVSARSLGGRIVVEK